MKAREEGAALAAITGPGLDVWLWLAGVPRRLLVFFSVSRLRPGGKRERQVHEVGRASGQAGRRADTDWTRRRAMTTRWSKRATLERANEGHESLRPSLGDSQVNERMKEALDEREETREGEQNEERVLGRGFRGGITG